MDDYEGVTHAGIAVQALDTGRILMQQRAWDEEDADDVRGTFEFPGGGLEDGEAPQEGAWREWVEETGLPVPDHEITGGWRNEVYQGFVATVSEEFALNPDEGEIENPDDPDRENPDTAAWFTIQQIKDMGSAVRPEVLSGTDWSQFASEEDDMTETDDVAPVPWFGIIAPEGKVSGDKRMFSEGSLRTRTLPLPLTWQKISTAGHDNAVTVAIIEDVWRQYGMIWGRGRFLQTPEADEAVALVAEFGRYGVSIDADDLDEFSIEMTEDGVTLFTDARQCSACMVSIPAFAEAFITLGEFTEEKAAEIVANVPSEQIRTVDAPEDCERDEDGNCIEMPDDPEFAIEEACVGCSEELRDYSEEERSRMAESGEAMPDGSYPIADCEDLSNAIQAVGRAKDRDATIAHIRKRASALDCDTELPDTWAAEIFAAPGLTEDGPGWVTRPVDTDRLRDYWVRGEGSAKIAWGTPGDFNRCRVNLAKYVKPQYLSGYCSNRHYDALGYWPGQHAAGGTVMTASAVREEVERSGGLVSLTASAPAPNPPKVWFEDPGLTRATALTVTDDGQVFGHLATWGQCHIGFDGECILLPNSVSDYSYFRIGVVDTDGGPVYTGALTMGGGHAAGRLGWRPATEHYDSTSSVVADVAVGEDEIGVWMSGALRAGVTDEQVAELRAAGKASGDWREVVRGSGQLELVAALVVNVGGFLVPRVQIAASGGRVVSLVAAGIVNDDPVEDLVEEVEARLQARAEKRQAVERLNALRAKRAAERKSALRNRI